MLKSKVEDQINDVKNTNELQHITSAAEETSGITKPSSSANYARHLFLFINVLYYLIDKIIIFTN